MTIEFDKFKFPTTASWRRTCEQLSEMDESKERKIAEKFGWKIVDGENDPLHKDEDVV